MNRIRSASPLWRAWATGVLVGLSAALVLGLLVAPPDAIQGEAQRFMYLHVPAAWGAYLCFAVVLAASLQYLRRRGARAADIARAGAEIGLVLTAITLASGSVWGALTWGTWWVWDARVTTTVAMGLVYLGYLLARGIERGQRSQTGAALLGVLGFAVVPVVHFSVLWWRTLHQPATILGPDPSPPIDPLMALALAAAVATCTLLIAGAVPWRARALATGRDSDHVRSERPVTTMERSG